MERDISQAYRLAAEDYFDHTSIETVATNFGITNRKVLQALPMEDFLDYLDMRNLVICEDNCTLDDIFSTQWLDTIGGAE